MAAACELTSLDTTSSASAKVHGCSFTSSASAALMTGRLASNTVSAIQATPNTATTAIMPARKTSFLPIAPGRSR